MGSLSPVGLSGLTGIQRMSQTALSPSLAGQNASGQTRSFNGLNATGTSGADSTQLFGQLFSMLATMMVSLLSGIFGGGPGSSSTTMGTDGGPPGAQPASASHSALPAATGRVDSPSGAATLNPASVDSDLQPGEKMVGAITRFGDRIQNLDFNQEAGNCSMVAISNAIDLLAGGNISEEQATQDGIALGGTREAGLGPEGRNALLNKYIQGRPGLSQTTTKVNSLDEVDRQLLNGGVVVHTIDTGMMRRGTPASSQWNNHAVTLIGAKVDQNGQVAGYYMVDSSSGAGKVQFVPKDLMQRATFAHGAADVSFVNA